MLRYRESLVTGLVCDIGVCQCLNRKTELGIWDTHILLDGRIHIVSSLVTGDGPITTIHARWDIPVYQIVHTQERLLNSQENSVHGFFRNQPRNKRQVLNYWVDNWTGKSFGPTALCHTTNQARQWMSLWQCLELLSMPVTLGAGYVITGQLAPALGIHARLLSRETYLPFTRI